MLAYLPLLIALAGLLLYVLPANGKVQEIGRILFFAGVLVFIWHLGMRTVRLF